MLTAGGQRGERHGDGLADLLRGGWDDQDGATRGADGSGSDRSRFEAAGGTGRDYPPIEPGPFLALAPGAAPPDHRDARRLGRDGDRRRPEGALLARRAGPGRGRDRGWAPDLDGPGGRLAHAVHPAGRRHDADVGSDPTPTSRRHAWRSLMPEIVLELAEGRTLEQK